MNALNETSVSAFCQFNLTDEELICEYRRTGDDRFFEELAARYRTRLPRYLDARYKLTNAQLEDAVQSTFATVYRKLDQYDASRSFRPWFYRVATTRTLDLLRAQKRADKFFFGSVCRRRRRARAGSERRVGAARDPGRSSPRDRETSEQVPTGFGDGLFSGANASKRRRGPAHDRIDRFPPHQPRAAEAALLLAERASRFAICATGPRSAGSARSLIGNFRAAQPPDTAYY